MVLIGENAVIASWSTYYTLHVLIQIRQKNTTN